MTVLRCTVRLLKRLKLPAKPPEPAPQANPLGEWHADLDFWQGRPFVVMLNGATGALLLLDGKAEMLRRPDEHAGVQFAALCAQVALAGPSVQAELAGFAAGFTFAPAHDRSLLGSLRIRRDEAWASFEHGGLALADAALRDWIGGLFRHPALGRDPRFNSPYHRPLDLLRQRLSP